MKININDWFVIINPVSGTNTSESIWNIIDQRLSESFDFFPTYTKYIHHASQIVEEAISNGYRNFLCIGGDGTLHDVVNGVMTQNSCESTDIKIAFFSCGTGNDWQRTNFKNNTLDYFIERFIEQNYLLHDVGKINCTIDKKAAIHYFINMAGVGFDAFVVQNMQSKKVGRFSYLTGMLESLLKYNHIPLRIETDTETIECKSYTSIIALNKFAGGGMKLAPDAINNDGLFDIVIVKDLSIPMVLLNTHRMYSGNYTQLKKVQSLRSKKVRVTVLENAANTYTQAEGELIGTGPFEFECISNAVNILI